MPRPFVPVNNHQISVPVRRVTASVNGVETYEYAYIPYTAPVSNLDPLPEPLPSEVVWLPTENTPPAGYIAWNMIESQMGGMKRNKGKGALCTTCAAEFPLSEMVKIRGKWYCTKNKCAEDQR